MDRRLDAVHVRHDHVADDEIRTHRLRPLHGGSTSIDGSGFEPMLIQDDSQSIGNHPLVVYHQHSRLCLRRRHLSAGCLDADFARTATRKIITAQQFYNLEALNSTQPPARVLELPLPSPSVSSAGWAALPPALHPASTPA